MCTWENSSSTQELRRTEFPEQNIEHKISNSFWITLPDKCTSQLTTVAFMVIHGLYKDCLVFSIRLTWELTKSHNTTVC